MITQFCFPVTGIGNNKAVLVCEREGGMIDDWMIIQLCLHGWRIMYK